METTTNTTTAKQQNTSCQGSIMSYPLLPSYIRFLVSNDFFLKNTSSTQEGVSKGMQMEFETGNFTEHTTAQQKVHKRTTLKDSPISRNKILEVYGWNVLKQKNIPSWNIAKWSRKTSFIPPMSLVEYDSVWLTTSPSKCCSWTEYVHDPQKLLNGQSVFLGWDHMWRSQLEHISALQKQSPTPRERCLGLGKMSNYRPLHAVDPKPVLPARLGLDRGDKLPPCSTAGSTAAVGFCLRRQL